MRHDTVPPEQTLIISGACGADEVFSLDPRITGEQLHWNLTRIKHDAEKGRFGDPINRDFATWPDMTAQERMNIDWDKVAAIARNASALALAGLAVDVDAGDHVVRHIVDGNHRVCARELLGWKDFFVFVVPETIENEYRVRFMNGNGKPWVFIP